MRQRLLDFWSSAAYPKVQTPPSAQGHHKSRRGLMRIFEGLPLETYRASNFFAEEPICGRFVHRRMHGWAHGLGFS